MNPIVTTAKKVKMTIVVRWIARLVSHSCEVHISLCVPLDTGGVVLVASGWDITSLNSGCAIANG